MNRTLIVTGFLLLLAAAVVVGLRLADAPASPHAAIATVVGKESALVVGSLITAPIDPTSATSVVPAAVSPLPSQEAQTITSASSLPATPPSPTGAEMVERWLGTTNATAGAVTVLLHWSSLKPDEQLPALGRVLNMLPDNRYETAQRVLFDPITSAEAAEVIFHDVVNRPSEVKLPVMLALIRKPQHPLAAMARTALVSELGIDDGVNQGAWSAHVHEYLHSRAQIGK